MNPIQQVMRDLQAALPGVTAELEEPLATAGTWILSVAFQGARVSVEWSPHADFGVTTVDDATYGESPDERYGDANGAASRVVELLRHRSRTSPPIAVWLRRLREERGLTQAALAHAIGVKQATLSKIENSTNVRFATVERIVSNLGGKLSIVAQFSDRQYQLVLSELSDAADEDTFSARNQQRATMASFASQLHRTHACDPPSARSAELAAQIKQRGHILAIP